MPSTASKRSTPLRHTHWMRLGRSPIAGRGAFAVRRIPKGTRIIEYTGERITPEVADERYDDDAMEVHHTFLFTLDDETIIDAAVRGNAARFINHSCEPNCEAVIEEGRIFIEALRDITAGEELTYDYAYERQGRFRKEWWTLYACRCGAKRCRGIILKTPKPPQRRKSPGSRKQGAAARKQGGKAAR
ncbi:MAG TPA: SET domain-containing protein-lysine N-methyltransferase [Gemmatimonadaceae bacterium]|nr:SET domain-containing protein-lysine N-methyltransferase [Gemmatimonadaceae bacterium]